MKQVASTASVDAKKGDISGITANRDTFDMNTEILPNIT